MELRTRAAWLATQLVGGILGLVCTLSLAAQELPDGPGRKELEALCGPCHGAEAVMGVARRDRGDWQQKVFEMIGPGGAGEQAAVKAVIDYLATNLGPEGAKPAGALKKVNVNQASAAELQPALSLSAPVAEALVKYRQDNGRFNDFAALKKALATMMVKIGDEKKDDFAF